MHYVHTPGMNRVNYYFTFISVFMITEHGLAVTFCPVENEEVLPNEKAILPNDNTILPNNNTTLSNENYTFSTIK